MAEDKRTIACNYRDGISSVARGALCYVLTPNHGNAGERVRLLARSRGGRWIVKWEDTRRLTNFRYKTVQPEHPRYEDVWDTSHDPWPAETLPMLQKAAGVSTTSAA
jgi:hypothetical protein